MMEKPYNVRPLIAGDEDKLFNLLCLAYKENAPYTMSEKKVRLMIAEGARDKVVIIGVIDGDKEKNELAGSIGAVFSQWWYTDDWHIEECWNFVHPNYRTIPLNRHRPNGEKDSVSYAKALVSYMKWVSEKMELPLHMGILTSTRMEAKIRLYQREMPQVGAAFVYNMKAGHGPIAGELANG